MSKIILAIVFICTLQISLAQSNTAGKQPQNSNDKQNAGGGWGNTNGNQSSQNTNQNQQNNNGGKPQQNPNDKQNAGGGWGGTNGINNPSNNNGENNNPNGQRNVNDPYRTNDGWGTNNGSDNNGKQPASNQNGNNSNNNWGNDNSGKQPASNSNNSNNGWGNNNSNNNNGKQPASNQNANNSNNNWGNDNGGKQPASNSNNNSNNWGNSNNSNEGQSVNNGSGNSSNKGTGEGFERNNTSSGYSLPRPCPRVRQSRSNSCWIACATMLKSYRDNNTYTEAEIAQFLGEPYVSIFNNNLGLDANQKDEYVRRMRWRIRNTSDVISPRFLRDLLQDVNAPIIVTIGVPINEGVGFHAIVMTGVGGDGTAEGTTVTYIDPDDGQSHQLTYSDFEINILLGRNADHQLGTARARFIYY